MDKILEDAQSELHLYESIMKRVEGIYQLGEAKALAFYLICTMAGYLTSKHAIRESYFAKLSKTNPAHSVIENIAEKNGQECSNVQTKFKRLAWLYKEERYIMENILCKNWRGPCFRWDYVATGQTMYCKVKDTEGTKERTMFLRKEWGGQWQEFTPHLHGFHSED